MVSRVSEWLWKYDGRRPETIPYDAKIMMEQLWQHVENLERARAREEVGAERMFQLQEEINRLEEELNDLRISQDVCACCKVVLTSEPEPPLCTTCHSTYAQYDDGTAFCAHHEPQEEVSACTCSYDDSEEMTRHAPLCALNRSITEK
jgi:hypothetical protein